MIRHEQRSRKVTIKLASVLAIVAAIGLTVATAAQAEINPDLYEFESVSASRSTTQAGAHPNLTVSASVTTDPGSPPDGDGDLFPWAITRDMTVELPPGMTGNPNAVAPCSMLQFATAFEEGGGCPNDSQVGLARLKLYGFSVTLVEPIYSLETQGEKNVARLGFYGYTVPVVIDVNLQTGKAYALSSAGHGFNSNFPLVSVTTELWGVPGEESHNTERMTVKEVTAKPGITTSPSRPIGRTKQAFLNNPSSCEGPLEVNFAADSYQAPGKEITRGTQIPGTTGCGSLEFNSDFSLIPTSVEADSPSGMDVDLSIDQTNISQPTTLAPATLKKAVVRLPEGMSLNPSSAGGLSGCSEDQVGLESVSPLLSFDEQPDECPESSKVGTATIESPVLKGPIQGNLYVSRQNENPFGTFLGGYLVARGQGATIKLAGRFDLDPKTGRITATFDDNPQQPFSSLELHFKGGDRGVLITPPACGHYVIETELVPWSAIDPNNPAPSEIVHQTSPFDVVRGPNGGPCPNPGALTPSFSAGTVTPLAGSYSPLLVRAARPDGSAVFNGLDITLPPGLVGKLAGIPYCPPEALAAAAAKSGTAELASPSCPAASRVGSVVASAGAGNSPVSVTGNAYLAGPYKGAPLSLAVITPAVTGPFDLGDVVVRAAIQVNPVTAQIHAVSDPLPTILQGVPLHLRSVEVKADRPDFTLNPTSCNPMAVNGLLSGPGASASLQSRFQVGGCKGLDFGPKLTLNLKGGTKRRSYPALRAVLTAKPGEANVGSVSVALPHSEFLAQEHINTVCTRVQFAANNCPAGSIYGHATAYTPLLDKPLEGPVYLRSSSHKLPDMVADLRGQIDIELAGRIDSKHGGIRTTFSSVPDAPVTKFVLSMKGGKKGLLVNSRNICLKAGKATVKMIGQNGIRNEPTPVLRAKCGGKKKK
jgi:hypothetical protein